MMDGNFIDSDADLLLYRVTGPCYCGILLCILCRLWLLRMIYDVAETLQRSNIKKQKGNNVKDLRSEIMVDA